MYTSTTSETVALTYDEIIFQARNRAYGAFDLRKQYRPTLSRALGLGVALFLGALAAPTLYARFWPQASVSHNQLMDEVTLTKLPSHPLNRPLPYRQPKPLRRLTRSETCRPSSCPKPMLSTTIYHPQRTS